MKKLLFLLIVLAVGSQSCDRETVDSKFVQESTIDNLYSSSGVLVFKGQIDFDSFNTKNQKISVEGIKELEKKYSYMSVSSAYAKKLNPSKAQLIFAGPMGAVLNQDQMVVIESVLYQFSANTLKQIQLTKEVSLNAAILAIADEKKPFGDKVVETDITYKTIKLGSENSNARVGAFGNNTVVANQKCADDGATPAACIWAEATIRLGSATAFFPARDYVFVNVKINRNGNFSYQTQQTPYTATVGAYGNFTVNTQSFSSSSGLNYYTFPFSFNFDGQPSETEINIFTSPTTAGSVLTAQTYFTGDINYRALYNQSIDKVPAGQAPTNVTGYYLFQP